MTSSLRLPPVTCPYTPSTPTHHPPGWLSKPDFKRAEQDISSYQNGVYKGKSSLMGSLMAKKSFTKRFFVLESSSLK